MRQSTTITSFFKRNNVEGIAEVTESKRIRTASTPLSRERFSKDEWVASLTDGQRALLKLEIETLEESWIEALHKELTMPYFLELKKFLALQKAQHKVVFPPAKEIYSWSRLTPLKSVRVVILGQDPYHNYDQAHGLAFSVKPPTPPPPSLVNIYKELESCYPGFKRPKTGDLTNWARQGVLLLNNCLTVEAHKANSHANKGWERFTEKVLEAVLKYNNGVCLMAWGSPAAKRIAQVKPNADNIVLKTVHPSPLSASRGWFGCGHFIAANKYLKARFGTTINWTDINNDAEHQAESKSNDLMSSPEVNLKKTAVIKSN